VQVWGDDTKYATPEAIKRCWRKADILPATWNADINNDVGFATMPDKHKTISKEDCAVICDILSKLKIVSCHAQSMNDSATNAPALVDSLVNDHGNTLSPDEQEAIICNWMEIEDDPFVQEAEVEEAIIQLELELTEVQAVMEQVGVESDSDEDEDDTVINIRNNLEAEAMLGDIVSYCKRQKFRSDMIHDLEKAAKKIRNAHIESRANCTTVSTITNFFLPQKK
jgi:hypothetical protein